MASFPRTYIQYSAWNFFFFFETPKSLAISSSSTLFDRPHLNSISDSILCVETLKSREELCFSSSWELIWPMFLNGGKKVFHKCLICNCRWRVEVWSTVTPSDVCFRVCLASATRTKYSSKLPPTSRSIVCRSKYASTLIGFKTFDDLHTTCAAVSDILLLMIDHP